MKVMRKVIHIEDEKCDGCGQCIPSCAEGALTIVNGKARVVADKFCDGLGACLGECPNDALHLVEREAEEFDEEAVEHYLSGRPEKPAQPAKAAVRGCPSSVIQDFGSTHPSREADAARGGESALTHWPVQIRLVPPTAPFLKHADILVLADCSAVAMPTLHRDLLKGKVVLMGCPKFDDVEDYIRRFAEIFRVADIQSVTTVVMEVPCCSGLPMIVKKGMAAAGKDVPMEEVTIGVRGETLQPGQKLERRIG
ncbi:MAG: 4Fe-4S ferredoxin [Desulfobacterales bacterium]